VVTAILTEYQGVSLSKIIVFGAGGRAGRRVVEEAVFRGHSVTASVRNTAKHADLAGPSVQLSVAEVTSADDIAATAAGHDAAVVTLYTPDVPADQYYSAIAHAMLDGLRRAGVHRLVVLGIGTLLESSPGVRFMDQPEFPPSYLPFNEARVLELEILRAADTPVDWVVLAAPPSPLDNVSPRTGTYRATGRRLVPYDNGNGPEWTFPYNDKGPLFTFTDLAVALVDEATEPRHHRDLVGIAP
jgi:putative NADH-flavin reductase